MSPLDDVLSWIFFVALALIPLAALWLGVEKVQSWAGKQRSSSAEHEAALMRRTRDEVRRHG
jgi:hypothetical protein